MPWELTTFLILLSVAVSSESGVSRFGRLLTAFFFLPSVAQERLYLYCHNDSQLRYKPCPRCSSPMLSTACICDDCKHEISLGG